MTNQFISLARATTLLTVVIVFLRCIFSASETTLNLYSFSEMAIQSLGLSVFFMTLYITFLWRYNPFEKTPKLHKKYEGNLISSYDNISRDATLIIKQTLLSIRIIMRTEESSSESKSAMFTKEESLVKLIYTYTNTSKSSIRDRSPIHYGTCILDVESPNELTGTYFTDRKTTGDMNFKAK